MTSDEPTHGPHDVPGGESEFAMDPQAVIWELADMLVRGQRDLASFRQMAETVRQTGSAAPREAAEYLAALATYEKDWYGETLPMIAASMKLAHEVYETFGPGMTRVQDPTEAAIWNNKHHVWFREFTAGR
ncbi:hypothetical protein [Mycobacterium sp. 236(2023)]|uniref:hypothetical protein n=1 Tax=Mycobacterium sp. 236(2023) TaxID=3038163 RepID=UPI00241530E1|nr:hypothetical protein [Mycobacterium sp. 236(2023)]MDG4669360.1 hypothetical protein [Mycobacterium sp. 236(2023)]